MVWDLVNPEGDSLFNKRMFAMAMHFLSKKKLGHEIPETIPKEMHISLDPEAFFA